MELSAIPAEARPWETYWRNRIADEIALEREKVKRYYQRDKYGMKDEHFTRLNIFSLCESISRAKAGEE